MEESKPIKPTKLMLMRKKKGLTQKELAQKADIAIVRLRHYEYGFRKINNASAIVAWRIAKELGCNIEDILEIEEDIKQ